MINIISKNDKVTPAEKIDYKMLENTRSELYSNLHNDITSILNTFETKKSTKLEFFNKMIRVNQINHQFLNNINSLRSMQQNNEAYNFMKNADTKIVFDLETLSGKNAAGVQEVDSIFGYAYTTIGKDGNAKTVSGIQGIDRKVAEKYRRQFSNFNVLSGTRSNAESVKAEYLAKLGASYHGDLKNINIENNGRISLKNHVAGSTNRENIFRGIELLEKVQEIQEKQAGKGNRTRATIDLDYLYRNILDAENTNTSIIGQNILEFDIPVLNQWANKNGFNKSINRNSRSIYDSLPILRFAQQDKDFYKTFYPNGLNTDKPLSLEPLIKSIIPEFYEKHGAAHDAGVDTLAHAALLSKEINNKTFAEIINDMANKNSHSLPSKITSNSLLISTGSLTDWNSNNILGFVIDPYTGEIKTNDGFTIGKDSISYDKEYKTYPIKKHAAYKTSSIGKFKPKKDFKNKILKAFPTMVDDNLMILELENAIQDNPELKNKVKSYLLGSEKDLEKFLNYNFINYGTIQKDGTVLTNAGAEENLMKTGFPVSPNNNNKVQTFEDIKNRAKYAVSNDSAARSVRRNTYYGTKQRLNFGSDVTKKIKDSATTKKEAERLVLTDIMEVAKVVASGKPLTLQVQKDIARKYLNPRYDEFGVVSSYLPNFRQIDNIVNSYNQAESIREQLTRITSLISGLDKDNRDVALGRILDIMKSQSSTKDLDWKKRNKTNLENTYQIDLYDLDLINDDPKKKEILESLAKSNIVDINLASGKVEKDLVKKISRASGNNKRITIKSLKKLADQLNVRNIDTNNPDELSKIIVTKMKKNKESGKFTGILDKYYYEHDVSDVSSLKDFNIDDIDNIAYKVIDQINKQKKMTPGNFTDIQKSVMNFFVDNFDEEEYKKAGFSEQDINKLKTSYNTAKKDIDSVYHDLFGAISKTNSEVYIDKDNFFIVNNGNTMDIGKSLPKLKSHGINMYYDINGVKYGAKSHVLLNNSGMYELTSTIGKAKRDVGWSVGKATEKAIIEGRDPLLTIRGYIKNISKKVRESENISTLDPQEIKSQGIINLKDMAKNIPTLLKNGYLEDLIDEKDIEKIKEIKEEIGDHFSDYHHQLWNRIAPTVIERLEEQGLIDKNASIMLKDFSYVQKPGKTEEFNVTSVKFDYSSENFESVNRAHQDSVFKTEPYLKSTFYNRRKAYSKIADMDIFNKAYLGTSIKTQLGAYITNKTVDGLGKSAKDKVSRDFMVRKTNMTSDMFKDTVDEYIAEHKLSREEKEAIKILKVENTLIEGAGLLDARISESIYENRDIQILGKIRLLKDHARNVKNNQELMLPTIYKNKDTWSLRYKAGFFVDEKGIAVEGYDEFSHSFVPTEAKHTGFSRFGFFTKEEKMLVDENRINKFLKENSYKIKSVEDAHNLLMNKFDGRFYVKNLFEKNTFKLAEDSGEKHATSMAIAKIGSINNKIGDVLDDLGLGEFKNKLLDFDTIDTLVRYTDKNIPVYKKKELRYLSNENLSNRFFKDMLHKHNFTEDSFKEAVLQERYAPSIAMEKIFGGNFLTYNDKIVKHEYAPVKQIFSRLIDREMNNNNNLSDAEKNVRDLFEKNKWLVDSNGNNAVTYDKNNGLVANINKSKLNLNSIMNYFEKNNIKLNMGTLGDTNWVSLARIKDITNSSSSGVTEIDDTYGDIHKFGKLDDQTLGIYGMTHYEKDTLTRLRKDLGDSAFNEYFGHVAKITEDGIDIFNSENKSMVSNYINNLKSNQFYKPKEKYLHKNDKGFFYLENRKPIYISEDLANTVKGIKESGYNNVGLESAEKMMSFNKNSLAIDFNYGKKDLEFMKKKGFDVVSLSDYALGNTKSKNLLIDLSNNYFEESINNGNMPRYLAIGYMPDKHFGDADTFNAPQKILNNINKELEKIKEASESGKEYPNNYVADNNSTRLIRAEKYTTDFKQALNKYTLGKQGVLHDLSTIEVESNVWGKARLADYVNHDAETGLKELGIGTSFLDEMKFGDKAVSDLHRAGKRIDYTILSEEFAEKVGLFDQDYMNKIGAKTRDEVINIINSQGLLTNTQRYPAIYAGTLRPTSAYINKDITGNKIIEYHAGAITAKTDADGDFIKNFITKFVSDKGERIDSILAATSNNEEAKRVMKDHKALMMYNAAITNRSAVKEVEETEEEAYKNMVMSRGPVDREGLEKIFYKNKLVNDGIASPRRVTFPTFREHSINKLEYNNAINLIQNAGEEITGDNENELIKKYVKDESALRKIEDYKNTIDLYAGGASRSKRANAGEINIPLERIRDQVFRQEGATNADRIIHQTLLEASEEGYLSPKHSSAEILDNPDVSGEFTRAIYRRDESGHVDWLKKNAKGKIRSFLLNDESIHGRLEQLGYNIRNQEGLIEDDLVKNAAIEYHAKTVKTLNDSLIDQKGFNYFRSKLGKSINAIDESYYEKGIFIPEGDDSLKANILRTAKNIDEDLGIEERKLYKNIHGMPEYVSKNTILSELSSDSGVNYSRIKREGITSGISNFIKNSKISNGKVAAVSAIGLGIASMIGSFVGSHNIEPPNTQAKNKRNEETYTIPQLRQQIQEQTNGATGGYVINIKANTKHNNTKKISNLVKQSLNRAFDSSNLNVSMNINDNSSNIDNRGIQDLILSSL